MNATTTNGKPTAAVLDEPTGRDPGPGRMLALVQLCDSALPIGAFSHSWGLEAAVSRGSVRGPVALEDWARAWLTESVAPGDGLACAQSVRLASNADWDALADLNDLLTANKAAPTLRRASLNQGTALLNLAATWAWSGRAAAEVRATGPGPWHHAPIFGVLAGAAGASPSEALGLYLQNTAAGLVAAAVRAVPIGHSHGQQLLARLHPMFLDLALQWAEAPPECLGGLSPAYEVLCHAQTELYTRIFQS